MVRMVRMVTMVNDGCVGGASHYNKQKLQNRRKAHRPSYGRKIEE